MIGCFHRAIFRRAIKASATRSPSEDGGQPVERLAGLYSASNVVADTHFPVNLRHLAAALGGEISGDQQ